MPSETNELKLGANNDNRSYGKTGPTATKTIAFFGTTADKKISISLHFSGPEEVVMQHFAAWPIDHKNPVTVDMTMATKVVTATQQANSIANEMKANTDPAKEGGENDSDTLESVGAEIEKVTN